MQKPMLSVKTSTPKCSWFCLMFSKQEVKCCLNSCQPQGLQSTTAKPTCLTQQHACSFILPSSLLWSMYESRWQNKISFTLKCCATFGIQAARPSQKLRHNSVENATAPRKPSHYHSLPPPVIPRPKRPCSAFARSQKAGLGRSLHHPIVNKPWSPLPLEKRRRCIGPSARLSFRISGTLGPVPVVPPELDGSATGARPMQ